MESHLLDRHTNTTAHTASAGRSRNFASVLLEAGVSIKAVAEFLGHADPGFTLRTYTHLMSSSEDRMREAIEKAWSALEVP
ncbi:tyrosine-type recombinase/integrase [Nonomuraea sp. 10N515B]|uniref:tyrosine-type recombinase/integrase n=1 Tax=Nonomuraea sp. 10N515B TaxID=3457422 RepID=UPI003FCCC1E1